MELALLATTLPLVGALGYLIGQLRERVALIADKDKRIDKLETANAALLNRLTIREGATPVFDEKGNVVITPLLNDNPVVFHIKPPFAQAEAEWEQEELDNRPPAMSDFTKPLSEAEKERLRNTYANNGR
jgi:hypothetical protein